MGVIALILDILIPRFKTEAFCLEEAEDGILDVVCPYDYREEGENFDAVIDISYLNFFGIILFGQMKYDTLRKFSREDIL